MELLHKYRSLEKQSLIYRSNSIESLLIKEIKGEAPVWDISLALTKAATKERHAKAWADTILNSIPGRMLAKPKSGILDTILSVTLIVAAI